MGRTCDTGEFPFVASLHIPVGPAGEELGENTSTSGLDWGLCYRVDILYSTISTRQVHCVNVYCSRESTWCLRNVKRISCNTRWSSSGRPDPQWIFVDLARNTTIWHQYNCPQVTIKSRMIRFLGYQEFFPLRSLVSLSGASHVIGEFTFSNPKKIKRPGGFTPTEFIF